MTKFCNALILIAASAVFMGANAQTVYRCGNTYSQVPCPNARAVIAADGRTPTQAAEARKAKARNQAAAKKMQETREEQIKQAPKQALETPAPATPVDSKVGKKKLPPKSTAPATAAQGENTASTAPHTPTHPPKRVRPPEFFTAKTPVAPAKPANP